MYDRKRPTSDRSFRPVLREPAVCKRDHRHYSPYRVSNRHSTSDRNRTKSDYANGQPGKYSRRHDRRQSKDHYRPTSDNSQSRCSPFDRNTSELQFECSNFTDPKFLSDLQELSEIITSDTPEVAAAEPESAQTCFESLKFVTKSWVDVMRSADLAADNSAYKVFAGTLQATVTTLYGRKQCDFCNRTLESNELSTHKCAKSSRVLATSRGFFSNRQDWVKSSKVSELAEQRASKVIASPSNATSILLYDDTQGRTTCAVCNDKLDTKNSDGVFVVVGAALTAEGVVHLECVRD